MNNDLISRSDLKKAIFELPNDNPSYYYTGDLLDRERVLDEIDNAPPVVNEYTKGFSDGERSGRHFPLTDEEKAILVRQWRPQGEWYYGEDESGQDGWFCSECGFFVPWYYQYYEKDINFIRDYKACPHCLAEMVTYTGKDRDTKGGAE